MAVQFKLIMAVSWQCQTNPGFNPYLPPVTWLTRLTICVKTSNIEIVKIYNSVFSRRLINQGDVLCQIVNKSLFQLPPFHFFDRYMYCPYLDYHLNMLYSQRWNLVPVPEFFPGCVIFQNTICKVIFFYKFLVCVSLFNISLRINIKNRRTSCHLKILFCSI